MLCRKHRQTQLLSLSPLLFPSPLLIDFDLIFQNYLVWHATQLSPRPWYRLILKRSEAEATVLSLSLSQFTYPPPDKSNSSKGP